MKYDVEQRVKELARQYVEDGSTVRAIAQKNGISKSTVHKDLKERIEDVDISPKLKEKVENQLKKNKEERAKRGGLATKRKYIKQNVNT